MHAGRAWASDTITAYQGERLLSRGLVLLNTVEPDLMRHSPTMPDVAGPDAATPNPSITVFPGAEARLVDAPDAVGADGSPAMYFWTRSVGVVRLGRRQPGDRRLDPARVHHRPGDAAAHRTSTSPTRTRRSPPV